MHSHIHRSFLFLVIALLLNSGVVTLGQKRYLVSKNDEVIPLRKGESAISVMAKRTGRSSISTTVNCGNRFIFGYPEDKFPSTNGFFARHKDVMGEWFVAKATGTIDTIFWEMLGLVGAKDSTAYVRIHNSRIGPDYGPGIYNETSSWGPPCQNWGYFINTTDLDQGVAAFPDDATPVGNSTWTSTIAKGPPTLPPFTASLWGFGGYGVTLHANQINTLALIDGGSMLDVTVGQKFFLSQRVKGLDTHTEDDLTLWAASGFHVDNKDESYPSRNWKFYEHDSGPTNCAGVPTELVKRGWVARGGFTDDTLDVAVFNYWYSMVVTTNVPPDVQFTTVVHTTLSTASNTITAEILDCDPANPTGAGVKNAAIKWQLNGVPQSDIPMYPVGGLTWEGDLPGHPPGARIDYKIYAEDSTGLSSTGLQLTYRVVEVSNGYARIDTAGPFVRKSISVNPANIIDTSRFYLPPGSPSNSLKLDDGTAGPFDMGSNMPLFGDVGRYMWIGVNGGLAISKSAMDTVDVNSLGKYDGGSWTFPYSINRKGGRSDPTTTLGPLRMPGNFFAPAWGDLWHGDGATICGAIRFQRGYSGDTCLVIAEWDSIGGISSEGNTVCDQFTFRAIFNKCDGTIEYQYDDIGVEGQEAAVLVGFQADSTVLTVPDPVRNNQQAYMYINQSGYPEETRPRAGLVVKIYQATIATSIAGWNLLSVGVIPIGGDFSKVHIFPTATTPAFAYTGSYTQKATLENGLGYWMKYSAGQNVGAHGALLPCVTDTLRNGWNLIGAPGFLSPTSAITVGGGASLITAFYEYTGAYHTVTTFVPGYGYWVKSSGAGTMTICGNIPAAEQKKALATSLDALNSITITDNAGRHQTLYLGADEVVKEALSFYELPPAAPEFDARFSSQRMVETYPSRLDEKAVYAFSINISTAAYPLTVSWNIVSPAARKIVLSSADGKLGVTGLDGSGQVRISDENVKSIVLTLSDVHLPKVFALGQNYPNPFNPTTAFDVDIPKVSDVRIVVYDVLGREITTILSGQQPAGTMHLQWDGRNAQGLAAPTGIFFVRMTTGEFEATRKIMLMK